MVYAWEDDIAAGCMQSIRGSLPPGSCLQSTHSVSIAPAFVPYLQPHGIRLGGVHRSRLH
jgi:hypothetical protein